MSLLASWGSSMANRKGRSVLKSPRGFFRKNRPPSCVDTPTCCRAPRPRRRAQSASPGCRLGGVYRGAKGGLEGVLVPAGPKAPAARIGAGRWIAPHQLVIEFPPVELEEVEQQHP
eukprot:4251918-Pyramimonas_sp.AAC.1